MVEFLCPECLGPLETKDGKEARCSLVYTHRFEILFARRALPDGEGPHPLTGESKGPAIPASLEGVHCETHPDVQAVRRCRSCQKAICSTCLFEFPGRLYLCPTCATRPQEALTPKRRKYLMWSFIFAGTGTFLTAFLFLGGLFGEVGMILSNLAALGIIPAAIAGVACGGAAKPPGRSKLAAVQVAWYWNLALLAVVILLMLVGLLMGG
jgi:hypothetical protein